MPVIIAWGVPVVAVSVPATVILTPLATLIVAPFAIVTVTPAAIVVASEIVMPSVHVVSALIVFPVPAVVPPELLPELEPLGAPLLLPPLLLPLLLPPLLLPPLLLPPPLGPAPAAAAPPLSRPRGCVAGAHAAAGIGARARCEERSRWRRSTRRNTPGKDTTRTHGKPRCAHLLQIVRHTHGARNLTLSR